ncbi:MAG: hypothetical protein JO137_12820 [Hyphomicrobiales bacterium]|nr:hypothetical protein [Hyphomicrobiales bacterium]MBV9432694.1 hypothetical protein [Hyphomicrobiales bacterium]MBV9741676.1 hypothetical protein [Hyphomicrobiales bacterium]
MPLIVGGLIGLAMAWAVAKNDRSHKDALQNERQQIEQLHNQAHPTRDPKAGQNAPGG